MDVAVCIPTYNERENVPRLIRALAGVFEEARLDARVLVVDDASPDGTGDVADRLAHEFPFLEVAHRPRKDGIARAYVHAFGWALANGADRVLQMDCDLSHHPADVPRLLAATDGADLVLGSRYVKGGGVRNWPLSRRLVSRAGCAYAQRVLGVPIRDLTSGFKCFRREVLAEIGLDRISSKGYAFQVETTYRALRAGFRIVEIPIVFTERQFGTSKMTVAIAAEAGIRVPALRLRGVSRRL
jgi:dolichol-phosphate mannosyltransferase